MPRDRAGLARFLSRTPFFGGLDDIALRHVVAMTNERIFPRGLAKGLGASVGEAARGISRELGAPRWPYAAEA